MGAPDEVTALLVELGRGDRAAMERLFPMVYDELRSLARRHRHSWDEAAPGTVSLVHEAYLKLAQQTRVEWQSRAQFFYLASRAMRSILIDNARRFKRRKRQGEREALPIDETRLASATRAAELLALDEALCRLRASEPRLADIVDCCFFGGLTVPETAEALSLSPATVKRGWSAARVWLFRDMRVDPTVEAAGGEPSVE